ncbi:MAG: DoxX family protein [bacterium]
MTLLFLLLLLVVPYVLLTLAERWSAGWKIAPATRARVGLSLFFIFTAIGHFIKTEEMAAMLPAFVPNRVAIIILTGVLELLAAIGVWIPRLKRITGWCIMLMLIGFLPANIYSAINRVDFGGHESGPIYLLVRIPFQFLVIAWAYFATEQKWLNQLRQR